MISVCIPTFNGELYIEEQINSILMQLNPGDEIVISDDNSTDKTLAKLLAINDNRIKISKNPNKAGLVHNVENALNQAIGDIIYLADQDDVWVSDKVAIITPLMEKYNLVLSDAFVTDASGNILNESFFAVNFSGKGFLRNWVNNSFMGCCMTFNRKILEIVLPFPSNIAMHDSWIGLNAALRGNYFLLRKPLIYYRRHGNNTITTFRKNYLPIHYQIRYRLVLMMHILKRWAIRKSN